MSTAETSKSKPINAGATSDPKGPHTSHKNYIKVGLNFGVYSVGLARQQLDKLSQQQRVGALLILAFIFFWPLVTLSMLAPWLLAGGVVAYSVFAGFEVFIDHLEEAINTELGLSDAVIIFLPFHRFSYPVACRTKHA